MRFRRLRAPTSTRSYFVGYGRHAPANRTTRVKQAILATVVSVEKQHSDLLAVRLECEELSGAMTVLATGLDCERGFIKTSGPLLDVTCEGDPRAEIGDTVPVIVSVE